MDDEGSRADVALIGAAITVGMIVVVSMTETPTGGAESHEERRAESAELAGPAEVTEVEPELPDELGEFPWSSNTLSNCASMIGCFDWSEWNWKQWVEEQLAAGKDPFGPHETASSCVGFCFNAFVESVDEEDRRLARVLMIGKTGEITPAIVERTTIFPSSERPEAEGKPMRFACFDRFVEEDGLRFESCSQMAAGK